MKPYQAIAMCLLLICALIGAAHAQTNNYNTADKSVRVATATDATSITPNSDTSDMVIQTNTQGLGTLTINNPIGTPVAGQKLIIRVKSTNAQTLAYGTQFRGSTDVALPTTLSGSSKNDYLGVIWNAVDSKWDCVAKAFGY